MKKLSAYAIVIMIAVAVFVQSSKMNDREENELFLSNVEALAGVVVGEGDDATMGQWKRIVDVLGCYLRHECSTAGDGIACSPLGATAIIKE